MGQRGALDAATAVAKPAASSIHDVIDAAMAWLGAQQAGDGHWVFELEADATIPAEYVFLDHFLGTVDDAVERKIANYLRRTQGRDGGWPLYHDGEADLSATVKAYFALKLIGDAADEPHMRRAREVILARGGAAHANVFTRFILALFGEVPWRAVPVMRVEAMLLPKWAPFHLEKISYWSRTTMVPLFVLATLKPRARNPRGAHIRELFLVAPERHRGYLTNPTGHWLGEFLLGFDGFARLFEPFMPKALERLGVARAMAFIEERANGEDGLGGIFPPMAFSLMVYDSLGYSRNDPRFVTMRKAVERLLIIKDSEAYLQPCVSPVWDTALALHAMLEAGLSQDDAEIQEAARWLEDRQILSLKGDWTANRGNVRPGGWAFQYRNDYYPDVDDTAVVVMALHRIDESRHREAVVRGAEWVLGMQSRNGGWGAFDADNEYYFLENLPFADHGALLDPPTADVSARCLGMLAQLGYSREHPAVARALQFLRDEQEPEGSWFGRWGTNYIYGTWSVLSGLNAIGEDMTQPYVRRAVEWLKSYQREDGGWGEDCASYWPDRKYETKTSTPSQTAWALLGLMAAGEVDSDAVRKGIAYLLAAPRDGGKWQEEPYNAVGFPRVFYLRYHGYSAYFPLWALARYRNLKDGNAPTTLCGL
jgi:squalene-hopene/tetraprenyl-beta-curcumene cyclase